MSEHAFKIIICGAGIAGLCSAIALRRLGHEVIILESAKELSPIGTGIHIPPNATRVLGRWEILDRFEGLAIKPQGFTFRRYNDSRVLAKADSLAPDSSDPYWLMKRADYQSVLHEVAMELCCELRLGCRVLKVEDEGPSVVTADGKVEADLIIVADGIKSALRQQIIPEDDTSPLLQPLSTYRAWSPAEEVFGNAEAAALFAAPTSNIWIGPNRHAIIYPTAGGKILAINGTFPARNSTAAGWNQTADTADVVKHFADFDPVVRDILAKARDCKAWALAETPRLVRWTSKGGRIALVGDAAHGMLQFLAQGAAMATEDAAALAECIKRAKSAEQISTLMKLYERSRKWRCERVQANARRNGDTIHTPDGEEQEIRDRKMEGASLSTDEEVDCGPLFDDTFKAWLYGHNVFEHTASVLDAFNVPH